MLYVKIIDNLEGKIDFEDLEPQVQEVIIELIVSIIENKNQKAQEE